MLRDQVGGDAVEPRASRRSRQVVRGATLERDAEDVADHRLCFVGSQPANEIPVEHRRVAIEQDTEPRRFPQRRRDHVGVGLVLHTPIFPAPGVEFARVRRRHRCASPGDAKEAREGPARCATVGRTRGRHMAEIHGSVEPGFEDVRDTLSANLDSGEDVGASVAVIVDGQTVVDIWGGHRDEARTEPWERDTIINVWSTTKTMAALCALVLADRGELDLHSPVARVLAGVQGEREGRRRGPPRPQSQRRPARAGRNRCNRRTSTTGTRRRRCSPRRSRGGNRVRRPATTRSRRATSSARSSGASPAASIGAFFADEIARPARRRLPHRDRAGARRARRPGDPAAAVADGGARPRQHRRPHADRTRRSPRSSRGRSTGAGARSPLPAATATPDRSRRSSRCSRAEARSTASACCPRPVAKPCSKRCRTRPTSCSACRCASAWATG